MFGRRTVKAPDAATPQDIMVAMRTLRQQGYSIPEAAVLLAEVTSPAQHAAIIAAYQAGTL